MTKRKPSRKETVDNPMLSADDTVIDKPTNEVKVSSGFTIIDDLPTPPERKRGGIKVEKYPFGSLEVGQGFIIQPTEKDPEPWKSKQSTVTGAMRRYADHVGTKTKKDGKEIKDLKYTRRFKLYPVEVDGVMVAAVKREA